MSGTFFCGCGFPETICIIITLSLSLSRLYYVILLFVKSYPFFFFFLVVADSVLSLIDEKKNRAIPGVH